MSYAGCPELVSFDIQGKAVDIAKQLLKEDTVTDVYTDQKGESTILLVEEATVGSVQSSVEALLASVSSNKHYEEKTKKLKDASTVLFRKALLSLGLVCSGVVCAWAGLGVQEVTPKVLMLLGGSGSAVLAFVQGKKFLGQRISVIRAGFKELQAKLDKVGRVGTKFFIGPVESNAIDEIANIYGFDNRYQIAISASAEDRPVIREKLEKSGFEEIKTELIDRRRKKKK